MLLSLFSSFPELLQHLFPQSEVGWFYDFFRVSSYTAVAGTKHRWSGYQLKYIYKSPSSLNQPPSEKQKLSVFVSLQVIFTLLSEIPWHYSSLLNRHQFHSWCNYRIWRQNSDLFSRKAALFHGCQTSSYQENNWSEEEENVFIINEISQAAFLLKSVLMWCRTSYWLTTTNNSRKNNN